MKYQTAFNLHYDTPDPTPIRDIIESLQAVEALLGETAAFLPSVLHGLKVEQTEIRVRQIAQESPLRELFVLTLFLAFQDEITQEVPAAISAATGTSIPHNLDTLVTLTALILVFYGIGAIRDVVVGVGDKGPARRRLDGLIKEISEQTGAPEREIREKLDARYGDKTIWKRLVNSTTRLLRPSKRQQSAPLTINGQQISHVEMKDAPDGFLFDAAVSAQPFQSFNDVPLQLHAQDRDHNGSGWAAIVPGVAPERVRLKLLNDVSPAELWGRDSVRGDVTIIYENTSGTPRPKMIHLHRLSPG